MTLLGPLKHDDRLVDGDCFCQDCEKDRQPVPEPSVLLIGSLLSRLGGREHRVVVVRCDHGVTFRHEADAIEHSSRHAVEENVVKDHRRNLLNSSGAECRCEP